MLGFNIKEKIVIVTTTVRVTTHTTSSDAAFTTKSLCMFLLAYILTLHHSILSHSICSLERSSHWERTCNNLSSDSKHTDLRNLTAVYQNVRGSSQFPPWENEHLQLQLQLDLVALWLNSKNTFSCVLTTKRTTLDFLVMS